MDVVYLVRMGDRNEELRHSLRSLRHLTHDRVWIAGYCPTWVSDLVGRIPVEQNPRTKYRNGERNLRAALAHPDVSDPFVLMNDDFFILGELEEVPVLHRGPMRPLVDRHRRPRRRRRGPTPRASGYRRAQLATFELLLELGIEEPIAYEPIHVPMPVRKGPMLEALDAGAGINGVQYRTLYGNLAAIGGQLGPNVKISSSAGTVPKRGELFTSTNDRSWERGRIGEHLRELFSTPGPYERTDPPHDRLLLQRSRRDRQDGRRARRPRPGR